MPVESAADRAVFVGAGDFAVAITWDRAGAPSTFSAQFSRPATLLEGLGETDLVDREARLICVESDLPAGAAEGDAIAVAGQSVTFLCKSIRHTGDGMTFVDLTRA